MTSRKAAGYVKAYQKWQRSKEQTERLHNEVMARHRALTGGQLAEAQRVLKGDHPNGGE